MESNKKEKKIARRRMLNGKEDRHKYLDTDELVQFYLNLEKLSEKKNENFCVYIGGYYICFYNVGERTLFFLINI